MSMQSSCHNNKDMKTIIPKIYQNGYRKVSIFIGVVALTICLFIIEHRYRMWTIYQLSYIPQPEFKLIKLMNGVYTYSYVCIESKTKPTLRNENREHFNETKQIVIYGSQGQQDGKLVRLGVAGSVNSLWNHWDILFRSNLSQMPVKRKESFRDTAFFIQPTCPGNFHHFFIDEFIPLFSVVVLANRLHPGVDNQILYRTPQNGNKEDRCGSRQRYESFLWSVYANQFHDVFYNVPDNTCFQHAIFGSTHLLFRQRDIIDHVLTYYNLTLHSNRNSTDLYVTIMARKDRSIINTEEVANFSKSVGFQNVRIVDFQNISISEQLRIMSTSNVLIGIQGAGLQWSVFMPEGSHLIEIAWPQKHWGFYYSGFVPNFGVSWRGVGIKDVRLNWTSYAKNVRRGVPVSEADKPKLIKEHPKDPSDNIWKWSDIVIQRNEIIGTLELAYKELKAFH